MPDGRRPTDPRARMCYAPALPRHRRGVRRSACFRVRGGVCLEDRRWRCGPGWGWGPTGVERRVSDETRVGSADAAVKGSGGLSVLSRETAWGAPHRRERWPVPAAAVRAAVDADGCQRFETFSFWFRFFILNRTIIATWHSDAYPNPTREGRGRGVANEHTLAPRRGS